jgi:hypothetical protein
VPPCHDGTTTTAGNGQQGDELPAAFVHWRPEGRLEAFTPDVCGNTKRNARGNRDRNSTDIRAVTRRRGAGRHQLIERAT